GTCAMSRSLLVGLTWLVLGGCLPAWSAEAPVPQFLAGRLPDESGPLPPERWSATDNVLWKVDVPGLAWSSPVVAGDRVFLTTCINQGQSAEPRKGLYIEDLDANK